MYSDFYNYNYFTLSENISKENYSEIKMLEKK